MKDEIIEIGRRMYEKKFGAANDGNISCRISEKEFLITASGISKGFLREEDIIKVDIEGNMLEGNKKPSSELKMHLHVYKKRPDVQAICHAHPVYCTTLAVAGIALDKPFLQEVVLMLGKVPLVEYGTTGTSEVYKNLDQYLSNHDAFFLANHGALTIGNDLTNAFYKMEMIEHASEIFLECKKLGKMKLLNKDEVNKLISRRHFYGINPKIGL